MSDWRRLWLLACTVAFAGGPDWIPARPDYAWTFPQDHWSHDGYKTEWWYFTGHLTPVGDTAPRFGYQFTFFRIGLLPQTPDIASSWRSKDLVMGHAAVTDLRSGRHHFSEVVRRATPLLGGFGEHPDTRLAWSTGPPGTDALWTLHWNGRAFDFAARDDVAGIAFALSTSPGKPLVLQGPNGYSRKGEGPTAASLYYSFTRLTTTGTVTVDGTTTPVSGVTWMDKEFGSNQLSHRQVGWDWFSLQLDDGRDVMLYALRRHDGSVDFSSGTIVTPNGDARYLRHGDWATRVAARWRSPESGGIYPARWRVTIPSAGLDLDVIPLLDAQENVSDLIEGLTYWEGAVEVRDRAGAVVGRGYVELTGYVDDARLPV